MNSLVGNIAGYIELLLDVSILQLPNLLLTLFHNINVLNINKARRTIVIIPTKEIGKNDENWPQYVLLCNKCKSTAKNIQETGVLENEHEIKINNIVTRENI